MIRLGLCADLEKYDTEILLSCYVLKKIFTVKCNTMNVFEERPCESVIHSTLLLLVTTAHP